ncbi:MAG: DUF1559 domain-containing protein [Pirellulaceae bacterium]
MCDSKRRCNGSPFYSLQRSGMTVLELLVAISIIGILAALLLPAIGMARESARRVQCVNHLHQVGLALQNHHNAHRSLPMGWQFDSTKESAFGWAVPLLPYLDQGSLAGRIDEKRSVCDPVHGFARQTSLSVMLCPSDITERTFTLYEDDEDDDDDEIRSTMRIDVGLAEPIIDLPTANYVGVFGTLEPDDDIPAPIGDGAFLENQARRFRDFQRGLSNTIIVGERTMAQVPSTWLGVNMKGEDAAGRLVGSTLEGINNPLADECDFSSRHPGGANFLWADGHVSFISAHVDLREYHRWARLRDNVGH